MIKLYVMDRLDEIQSFDLERDVVYVGRSPRNDICLKDPYLSQRHLKVSKRGEKYFIQDLGSKNGTFVNGVAVSPDLEVEIQEGVAVTMGISVICLGKACLDSVMPFLDSIFDSDNLEDVASTDTLDRPMTLKRNMELISNVSDILRNPLSLNESLERILSYILDLLQRIDRAAIILKDAESGQIRQVLSLHKNGSQGDSLSYSRTIVQRVLKEGKAFRVLDTFGVPSEELSDSIELMRIKSALCVPMISRSQVRGAIYLDSIKEPYGFRKDDLILLTALGSSAAIAVENALLYAGKTGASLN
jgi:sigma-B regulation protein RsbU (phosphoserine phosphatase)